MIPPMFPPGYLERFTREHPCWSVLILLFGAVMLSIMIYVLVYP